MSAHARMKKVGRRWHWSIVVHGPHGQAHVYDGHEATWGLALAMLEYTWFCHQMEWQTSVDSYDLAA